MFPPASMVPPITESTFPVPGDPPMPTRGENIYFILLLHPSKFAPQKRLRKKIFPNSFWGKMSAVALIRREQQRRLIAPLIVLVGTNQPTTNCYKWKKSPWPDLRQRLSWPDPDIKQSFVKYFESRAISRAHDHCIRFFIKRLNPRAIESPQERLVESTTWIFLQTNKRRLGFL